MIEIHNFHCFVDNPPPPLAIYLAPNSRHGRLNVAYVDWLIYCLYALRGCLLSDRSSPSFRVMFEKLSISIEAKSIWRGLQQGWLFEMIECSWTGNTWLFMQPHSVDKSATQAMHMDDGRATKYQVLVGIKLTSEIFRQNTIRSQKVAYQSENIISCIDNKHRQL